MRRKRDTGAGAKPTKRGIRDSGAQHRAEKSVFKWGIRVCMKKANRAVGGLIRLAQREEGMIRCIFDYTEKKCKE